uniref:Uncharacterized protein n=1 Tax=Arundo donax TaxID=35708 RepID=A0A0A9HSF0_ARUDO
MRARLREGREQQFPAEPEPDPSAAVTSSSSSSP